MFSATIVKINGIKIINERWYHSVKGCWKSGYLDSIRISPTVYILFAEGKSFFYSAENWQSPL